MRRLFHCLRVAGSRGIGFDMGKLLQVTCHIATRADGGYRFGIILPARHRITALWDRCTGLENGTIATFPEAAAAWAADSDARLPANT